MGPEKNTTIRVSEQTYVEFRKIQGEIQSNSDTGIGHEETVRELIKRWRNKK